MQSSSNSPARSERKISGAEFEVGFIRREARTGSQLGDLPDEEPMEYVTISKWCQNWLRRNNYTEAAYLPNGIDPSFYPKRGRICRKFGF